MLTPGAEAALSFVVTDADTATALGSGDVPVLGTPRLLAWCEGATVAAVADALPPEQTTVGTGVELEHVRASRVGATVTARARLTAVDGRRLTFDVEAVEDDAVVGRGTVVRAVVQRSGFG